MSERHGRRLQAIVEAYQNPTKPSWENAKIWTGEGSPEDCASPAFKSFAARKNKEEVELHQARQKARELRGAPLLVQEQPGGAGGGAGGGRGKQPKGPKKGDGKAANPGGAQ